MARKIEEVRQRSLKPGNDLTTACLKTIGLLHQHLLDIKTFVKSRIDLDALLHLKERRYVRAIRTSFTSVLTCCLSFMNLPVLGQNEAVLVSNWAQSVSATSMVDDERLQTFTTGSHVDGYVLTRIELDFVLKTTADSFTVNLWTASGNRPGNRLAILETTEVVVGEPTSFTSSEPVTLEPDSQYFLHLTVKNPNDVLILKATKSGAEDRSNESTSWQIADNSIHIPSFGSTQWNTEASVIKIRIFGYERGTVQTGSS